VAQQDAWRAYYELALGLTETSRKKAMKIAERVAGKGGATAEQLQTLAEDFVNAGAANREAMTRMIRVEMDRALGRVGLATMDEVEELTKRVRELERELNAPGMPDATDPLTRPAAAPAADDAVAKKAVAKKTVAKKTVAKKTAGKKTAAKQAPAAGAGPAKTTAKKTVAKKTVAKKSATSASATSAAAAKKTAARKAPAKTSAVKKTVAKKAPAKNAPGKRTGARKSTRPGSGGGASS
jgi:polyhydroxyalkanoate synthesis regulator phasin